jgi:hypothetical protein
MTITQYIKKLELIAKKYPNATGVLVEDETVVAETPVIGYIDMDGDFATKANLKAVDAVCLN